MRWVAEYTAAVTPRPMSSSSRHLLLIVRPMRRFARRTRSSFASLMNPLDIIERTAFSDPSVRQPRRQACFAAVKAESGRTIPIE